jgi:hypothetical protein
LRGYWRGWSKGEILKFLADANIEKAIVEEIKKNGYDIKWVAEEPLNLDCFENFREGKPHPADERQGFWGDGFQAENGQCGNHSIQGNLKDLLVVPVIEGYCGAIGPL